MRARSVASVADDLRMLYGFASLDFLGFGLLFIGNTSLIDLAFLFNPRARSVFLKRTNFGGFHSLLAFNLLLPNIAFRRNSGF